jgi:hypothetical protein
MQRIALDKLLLMKDNNLCVNSYKRGKYYDSVSDLSCGLYLYKNHYFLIYKNIINDGSGGFTEIIIERNPIIKMLK